MPTYEEIKPLLVPADDVANILGSVLGNNLATLRKLSDPEISALVGAIVGGMIVLERCTLGVQGVDDEADSINMAEVTERNGEISAAILHRMQRLQQRDPAEVLRQLLRNMLGFDIIGPPGGDTK